MKKVFIFLTALALALLCGCGTKDVAEQKREQELPILETVTDMEGGEK